MRAAALLALPLSTVLLWAGLEKLRERGRFLRTLAELGLTGRTGRILAIVVPCAEILTAGGLLVVPSMAWPPVAVAALGTLFAAAGLLALRAGRPVACSCLGAGGGTLGRRQIVLLPVWLGTAAALQLTALTWPAEVGIQYLAGVLVGIGGLRALIAARTVRDAAGHRRAIDEAARVRRPIVVRAREVEAL